MTEDQFDPLDEAFGEDGLIELIDEEGESQKFELLGAFDMDGEHFLAVSEPTDEEDEDIESMEVFILKTIEDEDGNDIYVTPDDDEADAAFEFFLNMVDAAEAEGEEE